MTQSDSKLAFLSSGQNGTRVHSSDDATKRILRHRLFMAPYWSQGTALQLQVNLHLLFLHHFLQFCGSSGVLEGGREGEETVPKNSAK